MILYKYSLNRLFKVTYLDGRVEMICARGILDFVNEETQYNIHSIEAIAVSNFLKEDKDDHGITIKSGFENYPGLVEYVEKYVVEK
jgi:hypothetical protein